MGFPTSRHRFHNHKNKIMKFFARKMAVILLLTSMNIQNAHAQLGIGLGIGLTQFASKLSDLLSQAQAAGQILEVEAGGQIATAIDQARNAYSNELNLTIDKVSAKARETFNTLQSIMNDFEHHVYTDARDITRRANGVIHNLPFTKHFPQLFGWTPTYTTQAATTVQLRARNWNMPKNSMTTQTADRKTNLAVAQAADNENIILALDGDFYDLPRKRFDATIEVNSFKATNATKTNTDITFEIPKSALVSSSNAVKYNYVKIEIPYRKSFLLFFFKKQKAEFKVPIVTLPKNIGTLQITTTTHTPSVLRQSFSSSERVQRSDDDDIICGGEHADLAIHCTPPDAGWRVVPSTVSYHMIRSEGQEGNDWFFCGTDHSNLANACVSFSTRHKVFGTSGKLWFNIIYTAEKDVVTDQPQTTTIDINWEGNKVFEVPNGATWTGKFTQFDGKVLTFGGPLNNTYLKVTQNINLITFQTIP